MARWPTTRTNACIEKIETSAPARAAIRWGFDTRDFSVIVGIVHVDNAASRHVLHKLGMQFVDKAEWFGMPCEHLQLERGSFDG